MSTRWANVPALPVQQDALNRVVADALVGAAVVVVAARFLAALLVNVPDAPGAAPLGPLTGASTILAGGALVAIGLRAEALSTGIGPLFAGVFGLLAVVAPAVVVPATVAIGGGVAVSVWLSREAMDGVRSIALALLAAGCAGSLASGVAGLAWARPLTSTLSLVALGTLPAFVTTDRWSLVRAAIAFLAVVAFGLTLPFVTGAVTLVGTGAVGTPLAVIALAVAGVVTAGSAAIRTEQWPLVAAIALLGFAGVPAALPRAVPFALGVVMLVEVGR